MNLGSSTALDNETLALPRSTQRSRNRENDGISIVPPRRPAHTKLVRQHATVDADNNLLLSNGNLLNDSFDEFPQFHRRESQPTLR